MKSTSYLRLLMWSVVALIGGFVYWAQQAELDQVVRVAGTAVVSSRSQVIQSEQGGVVDQLLVAEGDAVDAGQPLLRLDTAQTQSGFTEAESQVAALEAQRARLRSEVFSIELRFPDRALAYPEFTAAQEGLLTRRREALDDEIRALDRLKSLYNQELDVARKLLRGGDSGLVETLRLEREVAQIDAQITSKRNTFFREAQIQLNQVQQDLARLTQTLAQRAAVLDDQVLRAPVPGVVKDIRVTTVGEVIRAGEDVMQIVPSDDALVFEVDVAPSDIAFVTLEQRVNIKVDAYDFAEYGGLEGRVIYVSADTLESNEQGVRLYRARVATEESPESEIRVLPGMTAQVEIKTDSQTLWSILTGPIQKGFRESFTAR